MNEALPAPAGHSWARQLLVSALALSRAVLRTSVAPDLTVPEALILWWLGRYPGCTASQLSLDLGVEPSGISVATQALERRGLIARVPDPRDRRRSFLRVTAPGRKAAARALGVLEERLERAASSSSPAQIEAAGQVLEGLIAALTTPADRPAATWRRSRPGHTPSRSPPPASRASPRSRRGR